MGGGGGGGSTGAGGIAVVGPSAPRASGAIFDVGGVSAAKAGEAVCGDAWSFREHDGIGMFLVVDGLGHGQYAFEAAAAAVTAFGESRETDARGTLTSIHSALRPTRGAAARTLLEVSSSDWLP